MAVRRSPADVYVSAWSTGTVPTFCTDFEKKTDGDKALADAFTGMEVEPR